MFRLKKVINKDKEIVLINGKFTDEYPYITLIIGANGTGKSLLLSDISKVFLNDKKYLSPYTLACTLNKKSFLVSRKNIQFGEKPNKLIVSSFLVNDKYVFRDSKEGELYRYLGARETSFSVGTKSFSKKLTNFIVNNSMNRSFMHKIPLILKFLNLDNYMSITLSLQKRKYFFDKESEQYITSQEEIERYFTDWRNPFNDDTRKSKRNTAPFSYQNFMKIKENGKVDDVLDIINQLKEEHNDYKVKFDIDFNNLNNNNELIVSFEKIKMLMELDLITTPIIEIRKNKTFTIEDASSGELHILYLFISILSNIENNSLILIDEPEVSLHPSWQIKFINFLQSFFKEYNSCHFIIATHSHFMVSDLKPENSSIVTFKYNEKDRDIDIETLDFSTYALSPENILYSVFNSRTSNNYYMQHDLNKVFDLINKNKDIQEIERIFNSLKLVKLDERDPLNHVLSSISEYLKENKNVKS